MRRFNFFDYNKRPLDKLKGPVFSTPLLNTVDGEWELARWWRDPNRGIRPEDEYELVKLAKNPDVTVRMRGVMEKCTFCVQRVQEAKIAAKVAIRDAGEARIPADAFTTACAQVCPTGAIVFGDKNHKDSRLSKLIEDERGYRLLEYLNLNQRVWYLARIRNPNPRMPGAGNSGKAIKSSPHSHHGHPDEHDAAAAHGEKA